VVAVCRGENADYARRLGAADVLDYTAADVAEELRRRYPDGIDAVAHMFGDADGLATIAELVPSGGHVASVVGGADLEALRERGIEATNVMGTVTTASLEQLTTLMDSGRIAPPELHTFPLDDAAEALRAVATGHVRGKIVVVAE
jgi:NADPH:quinone reductase-like Zn-dependent oxidoreductase